MSSGNFPNGKRKAESGKLFLLFPTPPLFKIGDG